MAPAADGFAPAERNSHRRTVHIEMSDEARSVLRKRGGTMAIDFIRPTG